MKTREEIEAIALKKYPSEPFRAFSDFYNRKMYANAKHNQKVFIEAYEQGRAELIQEIKDKVADIPEGETGEYFLAKVLIILKELK
jgi:hypothetical protein